MYVYIYMYIYVLYMHILYGIIDFHTTEIYMLS